jgi:AraC-like DNA-binding protein
MEDKSILIIGNLKQDTNVILHEFMKGYKFIYIRTCSEALSFIEFEIISLIILIDSNEDKNPMEDPYFVQIIKTDVPIFIIHEKNFQTIMRKIFQSKMKNLDHENLNGKKVENIINFFFKRTLEEPFFSNDFILDKKREIIYHELNGNTKKHKIQSRILKAISFMESHYDDAISLLDIAQAAYLSPCHFSRLFKKQIGITCSKYLSMLRINKAKELLKDTDLTVTEVCFRVGFNDLTHFERVFKGVEGITPSSYKHTY